MQISLITTVKNEAEHVEILINSIVAQTRLPDEWIVVDGGSSDGTVEKFNAIPFCTVIEITCNRARGRNLAISKASGEIIAVTDAGCVPGENWLADLATEVDLQQRQIAAGKTICYIGKPFDAVQHVLMDQFVNKWINIRQPAASCRSLAFPYQAWQEYPFPESLNIGEDSYLLTQWRHNGWTTRFIHGATMKWIPPQTISGFIKQYFTYIEGEGLAAIHTDRHLLRILFYLFIFSLLLLGRIISPLIGISLFLWFFYFLFTSVRLIEVLKKRTLLFRIKTIMLLFPSLIIMDFAKTAGFLCGRIRRLYTSPARKSP